MKKILLIAAVFLSVNCSSQTNKNMNVSTYDVTATNKTGADDYKMKKYVIAFLMPGDVKIQDIEEREWLEIVHYKSVRDLIDRRKLVVAESFADDQYVKAMYIFNVETIAEAKKLVETDPAINTGKLKMELHTWHGSLALMKMMSNFKIIEEKDMIE